MACKVYERAAKRGREMNGGSHGCCVEAVQRGKQHYGKLLYDARSRHGLDLDWSRTPDHEIAPRSPTLHQGHA